MGGLTPRHFLIFESFLSFNPKLTVAITESKRGAFYPGIPISIDLYALFRHDRIASGAGGIAIYIHDSLSFKLLSTFDVRDGTRIDFVVAEVCSGRDSMLLYVVYRPPNNLPRASFLTN